MDSKKVEQLVSEAVVQKPIDIFLEYEVSETILSKKPSFELLFGFLPFIKFKTISEEVVKPVKESYQVYPPSLGKLQLLSSLFLKLELDFDAIKLDPATELFKCCGTKIEVLAEIMAVAVLRKKEDLLDRQKINNLKNLFMWNTSPEDFSIIVGAILMQIDLVNFSNSIRLTKLFRLNEPKENKHGANRVEK